MSRQKKISESNPRTGALPSEQTANNQKGAQQDNFGMLENNKLIYKLVEQNVEFAGELFSDNLRFNGEVLTNVLYDNLYKLIGNKVEEESFVNWVAEELVKSGCIYKQPEQESSEEGTEESQSTEPKDEEVVYAIEASEYEQLVQKIYSAIELLKANKLTIFKLFSDVDNQIKNLPKVGQKFEDDSSSKPSEELDAKIKNLLSRLQGNRILIEDYVVSTSNNRELVASQMDSVNGTLDGSIASKSDILTTRGQTISDITKQIDGLNKSLSEKLPTGQQIDGGKKDTKPSKPTKKVEPGKLIKPSNVRPFNLRQKLNKIGKKPLPPTHNKPKPKGILDKKGAGMLTLLPLLSKAKQNQENQEKQEKQQKSTGTQLKQRLLKRKDQSLTQSFGKKDNKNQKVDTKIAKKPGILSRTAKRVGSKIANTKLVKGIKSAYSKVINAGKKIGAGISKIWGAVKAVGRFAKKVVGTTIKITKKVVGTTIKITKKVAKTFVKASHAVGKSVVGAVKSIGKGIKKVIDTKGASLQFINPSKIFGKIVFAPFKFIGKAIWSGIKKLAFKAVSVLGSLFGIGKKFVNKVGFYLGKLGKGIKDKTYRFIIKPIASMMVTIFGFAMSMILGPINFMKSCVSAILDRVASLLSNVKQMVTNVLRSTWSVFRKILFNPITIALLIGGLFLFFCPKILGWITGGFSKAKGNILKNLMGFGKKILGFLTTVWDVLFGVGKFIFGVIDWLTKPEGPIAKTISYIFKVVTGIKKKINQYCAQSGRASVDMFCMWLAGDYLGLLFSVIGTKVGKLWKGLCEASFIKIFMNITNAIKGFFKMWKEIVVNIWNAITGFSIVHPIDSIKTIGKCIGNSFKAVGNWISSVCNIFTDENYRPPVLKVDPVEASTEKQSQASIAVRSLKMKGMNGEAVLKRLDELSAMEGIKGGKNFLQRLQQVTEQNQMNVDQVTSYDEFLLELWEYGKGNPEVANKTLVAMLETPEISQRLMSAFFYYNPQTGQLMSIRPQAYLGQFLQNIRNLVSQEDVDWSDAFKTIVEAFDQANKERSHIINQQSDTIAQFAERISKFNLKDANANEGLKAIAEDFNNGKMFKNIDVTQSLKQIKNGEALTRDMESVTGSELGTNKLLKIEPITKPASEGGGSVKGTNISLSENYKVKEPKPDVDGKTMGTGRVSLPPSMVPEMPKEKVDMNGKSLRDQYYEWAEKRHKLINSGVSTDKLEQMGYAFKTFEEWKADKMKKQPPSKEEQAEQAEYRKKKLSALRLSKDIEAFHNQGAAANVDGFDLGKKPSILQIPADGLTQTMLMFSPEWRLVQGASKETDSQLLGIITEGDRIEAEKRRKAKEAEDAKKAAEAKERQREQEILDYSAKVEGGFIEVKIGEDVTAMKDAWELHIQKRNEAINKGISTDQLEKMGLIFYTWEEWKPYYRKMHGLPEDGIKRIPFEGKRKERNIDWSPRKALSQDELAKYGIQVSEDGPVMIPLDKALEVTNSLLQGAKTVYSIRDGLEVMKEGLDSGTKELKAKREGGVPVGVIKQEDSSGEVNAVQDNPPQQGFEQRF